MAAGDEQRRVGERREQARAGGLDGIGPAKHRALTFCHRFHPRDDAAHQREALRAGLEDAAQARRQPGFRSARLGGALEMQHLAAVEDRARTAAGYAVDHHELHASGPPCLAGGLRSDKPICHLAMRQPSGVRTKSAA